MTDSSVKLVADEGVAAADPQRRLEDDSPVEWQDPFRVLSDRSLAGIYLVQDGCLKYANAALAHILGRELAELAAARPLDLIHPGCSRISRCPSSLPRSKLASPIRWGESNS